MQKKTIEIQDPENNQPITREDASQSPGHRRSTICLNNGIMLGTNNSASVAFAQDMSNPTNWEINKALGLEFFLRAIDQGYPRSRKSEAV